MAAAGLLLVLRQDVCRRAAPGALHRHDSPEVYRSLNCSNRIYDYGLCFKKIEHPSVRFIEKQLNETDTETTIETPVGKQVFIGRKNKNNPHIFEVKWEVTTEDELKVATWREENSTWEWDQPRWEKLRAEWGDLGAPTMCVPRVNVQALYLEKMGSQNGIYALYDWPDTVGAYFRALEENQQQILDLLIESPYQDRQFRRQHPLRHPSAGPVSGIRPARVPEEVREAAFSGQMGMCPLGRRYESSAAVREGNRTRRDRGHHTGAPG